MGLEEVSCEKPGPWACPGLEGFECSDEELDGEGIRVEDSERGKELFCAIGEWDCLGNPVSGRAPLEFVPPGPGVDSRRSRRAILCRFDDVIGGLDMARTNWSYNEVGGRGGIGGIAGAKSISFRA